ncbi:MAG: RNA polymerase sigma factor RpoE [Methylococcales bacterium]|nr:RNA polymerase sigma factor RpoE [Methylococcales bacterium]
MNSYPKKNQQPDQELVLRAQKGDKLAFDLLVIKYQHKIIQVVNRYVKDINEAQDVTQETFIKAYRAIGSFRGKSTFYTWLYSIAINTAKNNLVSRSRRHFDCQIEIEVAETCGNIPQLREMETPETALLNQEILATIKKTIDELPEEMRVAIILCEFNGLSYEEIAHAMNCPIGTVRSRIFRAREALDSALTPLLTSGDFL